MSVVRAASLGAILGGLAGLALCYALGIVFGVANILTNSNRLSPAECIGAGLFFIGLRVGMPYGLPIGAFVGFFLGTIFGFNGLVEDRPDS